MKKPFAPALLVGTLVAFASGNAIAAMPAGTAIGASHEGAVVEVAKKKKMTRREEADQSARDGTVPARYRRNVPREYHQYIPFAKQ